MKKKTVPFILFLLIPIMTLLLTTRSYSFPSLTDHPHDEGVIKWEKDGSKDGSSAHNHRSNHGFGGLNNSQEPYTASKCWDDEIYRVDQVGSFDSGHCFVNENTGSDHIPDYFFVGTGWPVEAKARLRDAFNAWGSIESNDPGLVTGIAFEETTTEAEAEIKLYWENQGGASNGGFWKASTRELKLDNSMSWYYAKDPKEGQPGGIQNNQWHFYSVILHEVGHAVALGHQTDADDLMSPVVGEPPNVAGHRYFVAPDVDSIDGVRDLYSQPHRRIAFVIDDTGSMSDEIDFAKTTVNDKVDEFVAKNLAFDYFLLTYKDNVNYRGKTNDPEEIKSWVNALTATGGDDCPEEMLGALNRIAQEAPYSEAWLMTDAGFHGGLGDVATTIYNLVKANVTVHPIVYSWCFDLARADIYIQNNVSLDGISETEQRLAAPLSVGPESFAQIAKETGGHYFQIDSSETPGATTILLNEMVSVDDLTLYQDGVGSFGGSLINDGSFENGPPPTSGWTETTDNICEWIGDWTDVWGEGAYNGVYDFWAGGYCEGIPSTNSVSQIVTVPTSETTLSFWYMAYRPSDNDPIPDDYASILVNGTPVWEFDMVQSNDTFPNWAYASVDLSAYAGQNVELTLSGISTGDLTGNIRFDFFTWSMDGGQVPSKTYDLVVDSTTGEVNFLLNTFSGITDLALFDPNGVAVNSSTPGVTYVAINNAKYYQVDSPQSGVWQAVVSGDGTFGLSGSGNSSINFEYLSDTSLSMGNLVNLLASLTGPVETAEFQLIYPDGTLLDTVMLFDDGSHQDGSAGDGIYGGNYIPMTTGNFYLRVIGTVTGNSDFERIAAEVIRVHTLNVSGPPSYSGTPGATVVHEFSITNLGTVVDTYDLTVSSNQGWIDINSIPDSVTIEAGQTSPILVEVNVPWAAVSGMIDETVLVAVSQTNPLINDAASAITYVVEEFSIYMPIIDKP